MKIKMCDVTSTCENVVETIKTAVNKTKEITIHPKLDASVQIRNQHKELFGSRLFFNKEISLFKIIAIGICVIAGFAVVAAAVNALFGNCCNDNFHNCEENTEK